MRALKIMMVLCYFIVTGCSVNILKEFGDPTTDKALLFDAQMLIDDGDWTGAIDKFADMSTTFRSGRDVRALEASAYAGRCGMRFLTMVNMLAGLGTTKLFLQLMRDFPNSNAQDVTDCTQAETLMKAIDTDAANRTTDENLLMTFVSFAKIGSILALQGDANANGTPDWANDGTCNSGNLSDPYTNEIGTGFANAIASLTAIAASSSIGSGQLTVFTNFCVAISGVAPSYDFCSALNTTDVTANMRLAIRSLVQENEYVGVGSCTDNGGALADCICP